MMLKFLSKAVKTSLALIAFSLPLSSFAIPIPTSLLPFGLLFKPYAGIAINHYDNGNSDSGDKFQNATEDLRGATFLVGSRVHENFGIQLDYAAAYKDSGVNSSQNSFIEDRSYRFLAYLPLLKSFGTGFEVFGGLTFSDISVRTTNPANGQSVKTNNLVNKFTVGGQFSLIGKIAFFGMADFGDVEIANEQDVTVYNFGFKYYLI